MTQGGWSGQTGDLVASETRGRVGQRKGDSDMDGVGDRTERAKFWSGFSAAGAGLTVLGEAADAGRARLEAPRSTSTAILQKQTCFKILLCVYHV